MCQLRPSELIVQIFAFGESNGTLLLVVRCAPVISKPLFRIGVKTKKKCATNFRTNILCKNWKMVGKAVAAAWNPSKPGFDTCAITRCWLFTQFLSEKCIFCILCLVPFFWQFRKLHRRPSIYQCVCHRMTLLDFISIHEWKKRIVANRCVGVDLVLPNF